MDEPAVLAARYFDMWNTGDTSAVDEIVGEDWRDHGHPEVTGPGHVRAAVEAIRAARPGLRFRIDAILGDGGQVAVVGAAVQESQPDEGTRLVWLLTVAEGRLRELRTFRDTTR